MSKTKTLRERETELQMLMAAGARCELQSMADQYETARSRRPADTSIITYILVHEREKGLIVD